MGYDSLRIELRYRHIWQTKWAAAATSDDQPVQQPSSQKRGPRSTSLNRTVHYETEPDPGVDSPDGTAPPIGLPANNRARQRTPYRQYR